MPFDIICLFPGLPSVMKVWPQYSECCWRETSFSSCISHHWSSWALTILSPRGMGCHPAARWFNPVPCCPGGRGTALGKFLFPSPLLSNSYFFTLMVCWSHPWEVWISADSLICVYPLRSALSRFSPQLWREFGVVSLALQPIPRSVSLLVGAQVGETPPRSHSHDSTFVCGMMSNLLNGG